MDRRRHCDGDTGRCWGEEGKHLSELWAGGEVKGKAASGVDGAAFFDLLNVVNSNFSNTIL